MTQHSILRLGYAHGGHGPIALYDPDNKVEVKTAEEIFNGQLALRANMYDLSKADREDSRMETFDPSVKEILAVPAFEGG